MNGSEPHKNGRLNPPHPHVWPQAGHDIQKTSLFQFVSFRSYLPTGLQSTSDLYLNPLLLAAITDMLHL